MELQHVDKGYEAQLIQLKETILKAGSLVEEMIAYSQKALKDKTVDVWQKIINKDLEVDALEMEIHKQCTQILALRQPAAFDLRFIILGLRIATDLERIGDSTKNIGKNIEELQTFSKLKDYDDLPKMFAATASMVQESLSSFIKQDADLAASILKKDDVVDAYQDKIIDELIALMQKDSSVIEAATLLIDITHKIERIADHATNIAEEVIYLVKGKDIRHGRE